MDILLFIAIFLFGGWLLIVILQSFDTSCRLVKDVDYVHLCAWLTVIFIMYVLICLYYILRTEGVIEEVL